MRRVFLMTWVVMVLPLEVPGEHRVQGPEKAHGIHAVVAVEAPVLGEDDGGEGRGRDLREADQAPVDGPPVLHAGEEGEGGAVPGVEGGGGGEPEPLKGGEVGQVPGVGVDQIPQRPRPAQNRPPKAPEE